MSSLREFLGPREWPPSLREAALRPLRWDRRTGHDLRRGSYCPRVEVIDDLVGEHACLFRSEQASFRMERVDGWRTKTRSSLRERPIVVILG